MSGANENRKPPRIVRPAEPGAEGPHDPVRAVERVAGDHDAVRPRARDAAGERGLALRLRVELAEPAIRTPSFSAALRNGSVGMPFQ